jgi:hypothetical protein
MDDTIDMKQELEIIECYFIPNNNTSSATICGNCGKEKMLHTIEAKRRAANYMSLKGALEPKQERIYSEADMREAYFTAIRSTGEGWNAEYANGNCPNIEKTFNDGYEIFIEQYKTK